MQAAAVLGQHPPLALATSVGEVTDVVVALDEAVRGGLVAETVGAGGAAAVAFTHPLVRAAVYHDLGPARRAGLHLRAAAALDVQALEHRAAASGGGDNALAEELASTAAGESEAGAWAAAAAHLLTAARLATTARRRHEHVLAGAGAAGRRSGGRAGRPATPARRPAVEPSPGFRHRAPRAARG